MSTTGLGDEIMWLLGDTSGAGLTNLGTTGTATNRNSQYVSKPGAGANFAYHFPGGSIEIPSIFAGNSSAKSVSFWFHPDDTGSRFYFSDAPNFANSVGGVLSTLSTNDSFLTIGNGVSFDAAITTFANSSLNTGWNHQALVFDNGKSLVYLNGSLVLTSTAQLFSFPTYTSTSNDKALWGAESRSPYNTIRRFKGWMDDFRQFPRAITAQEVAHLATSRGVLGGITNLSLRASNSQGNLADTLLCSSNPDTRIYTTQQGFGYNSTTGVTFHNRGQSTTRDPMLLGYHTLGNDTAELRLDLPSGAGLYDVGIVAADQVGNPANCGFEIFDGAVGVSKMRALVQATAGNAVNILGQNVALDDFDRTDRSGMQCMEFKGDYLTLQRGQVINFGSNVSGIYVLGRSDPCDFRGINFRNTVSYDIDNHSFQYCVESVNAAYDANQGFGVVGTTTGKFFNRNNFNPNTAGAFFCDPNDYVRIDLPAGPGTYEMGAVFGDASAGGTDSFNVEDGGTGAVLRSATNATHGGFMFLDILGIQYQIGQFNYNTAHTVSINPTTDHLRVVNVGSSAQQISSLWILKNSEKNYDAFYNKTFQALTQARVR